MTSTSAGSDPWRVGLLFSRSGYLRFTQSEHFFGAALAIKEVNERGGVLGRPIEVVAYDPQSDPHLYREFAERLLVEDGISVIFGCSSSAERKAVLSSIERRNGLLWYPSFYEGFEYSPNVIYTGACPNQNSFPLANFIVAKLAKRVFLMGSDYIYPRETNRIMRDLIETQGGTVVGEVYGTPTGDPAWIRRTVDEIARLADNGPLTVFSTLVGTPSHDFYRLVHAEGLTARGVAMTSLTLAEGEVLAIGADVCAGHITSATYFASLPGPASDRFRRSFEAEYASDCPKLECDTSATFGTRPKRRISSLASATISVICSGVGSRFTYVSHRNTVRRGSISRFIA